jgi:hypothetical protein
MPLTVTIESGQRTVVLRTDGEGRLFASNGGAFQAVAIISPEGSLYTQPDSPALALDSQGYLLTDGDLTPLRLDDRATLSLNGLEIYRVQGATLIQIEPIEHALHKPIRNVRIQGPVAADKLAAYLIATYLLLFP